MRSVFLFTLLLIGGVFYILTNHSITKMSLHCSGAWQQSQQPETVIAVIENYRPWVVWGGSEGNLWAESRNPANVFYAGHLQIVGKEPAVDYLFSNRKGGEIVAGYRSSIKEITIKFYPQMTFSGTCETT
jgi:hypothetical protein